MEGVLQILGCGTSTGVPVPGCRCAVCCSDDKRNKRLRASALLRVGGESILIDAGPDFRQQALRAPIEKLRAVLFTHHHADHILGIDDLRAYNFLSGAALDVYLHEATLKEIASMFHYIVRPVPNYQGGKVAELRTHCITPGECFSVGTCSILPFAVEHGSAVTLGYRIGDIAYIADCKRVPEQSLALLRGVRTLVVDGLRYESHPTHQTVPEAIELGECVGAERVYLTHLTHTLDFELVSSQLPESVFLCHDGLELRFSFPSA